MKSHMSRKMIRFIAAMLACVMTVTSIGEIPARAEEETESTVTYYKETENFDSLETVPESYTVSTSADGTVTLEGTTDENKYLKYSAIAGKQPTLSYQFNSSYTTEDETPLWIEISLQGQEKVFKTWSFRARANSGNYKENILTGSYNEVSSAGGTELAKLSTKSFTKFIIKVEPDAETSTFKYSVWVDEYMGEAAGTGTLSTISDFGKINVYVSGNNDQETALGIDDFAVYASPVYQNVFAETEDNTGSDGTEGDGTGEDGTGDGETVEDENGETETVSQVIFKYDFEGSDTTVPGTQTQNDPGYTAAVETGSDNSYLKMTRTALGAYFWRISDGFDKIDQSTPLWVVMDVSKGATAPETLTIRTRETGNTNKTEFFKVNGGIISGQTEGGSKYGTLEENTWTTLVCKIDFNSEGKSFATYTIENGELKQIGESAVYSYDTAPTYLELNFGKQSSGETASGAVLKIDNIAAFQSTNFVDVFSETEGDDGSGDDGSDDNGSGNDGSGESGNGDSDNGGEEEPAFPSQYEGTVLYSNDFSNTDATEASDYENEYSGVSFTILTAGGTVQTAEEGYLALTRTDTEAANAHYFQLAFDEAVDMSPVWVTMKVASGTENIPAKTSFQASGGDSKSRTLLYQTTYDSKTEAISIRGADNETEITTLTTEWTDMAFKLDLKEMTYTAYAGGEEKYNGTLTFSDNTLKRLRIYVTNHDWNLERTLKVDDFKVFLDKDATEPDPPAPDVEMAHPELTDFPKGIAVMAGQTRACVDGQKVTLSTAAQLVEAGEDVLVPGSFIKDSLKVDVENESAMYSLSEAATEAGKTVIWDSRGVLLVVDENVDVEAKVITMLAGYLKEGEVVGNYALVPYFTQSMIDDAVALEPAGWVPDVDKGNVNAAEYTANALYYLTLVTRAYPDATDSNGKSCKEAALEKLRFLIKGGNEPFASVGAYWGHAIFASALTLAKHTEEIWNSLTPEEQARMDLLMEALAIAGNWGFNDKNNYKTGFSLQGNFYKTWNPNFRNTYVTVVLNAALYFGDNEDGTSKLDDIFANFKYDDYIERFEDYGFTNILKTWQTSWTAEDGTEECIGTYMENGGKVYLLAGTAGYGEVGDAAGGGVGVKVPFSYKGHDATELVDILYELLDYTYGAVVANDYNKDTQFEYCYILSGEESPYTGQMGMLYEFAANNGRSRVSYCYDSYMILNTVMANMKLLGVWNSSETKMKKLDNRMYVGNEDLIFKMCEGYHSYSNGTAKDEYEYTFDDRAVGIVKDIWRNFHCMLNKDVTIMASPYKEALPAEPKDGVTTPPDSALEAKMIDANEDFTKDSYYKIGDNLKDGTVEFDIVIGNDANISAYNAVVVLDNAGETINAKETDMILQFKSGRINVINGSSYADTYLTFNENYRFHVTMTFDVEKQTYSGKITPIYPEEGESYTWENYAFRVNNREITYVDSLVLGKGTNDSVMWAENIKLPNGSGGGENNGQSNGSQSGDSSSTSKENASKDSTSEKKAQSEKVQSGEVHTAAAMGSQGASTGDTSSAEIFVIIAAASLVAAVMLLRLKKKEKA